MFERPRRFATIGPVAENHSRTNDTLLVIGYGSLLSGYGLLAERRGGGSKLIARDAFAVRLENARRGLAKPSSHGHYLAMDLEPVRRGEPILARAGLDGADGLSSSPTRRARLSGSSCSKLRGARNSTCLPIASSCANWSATPRTVTSSIPCR